MIFFFTASDFIVLILILAVWRLSVIWLIIESLQSQKVFDFHKQSHPHQAVCLCAEEKTAVHFFGFRML